MTTTAAAIRDAMIALVEAITPALHSSTPLREFREQEDFRTWAESNPAGCLRRFSIRYSGSFRAATVSNTSVEETSDVFEVVVAYPNNARFGEKRMTSVDDVIASDQLAIHSAIGPPGYASFTAPATVIQVDDWERERSGPVTLAVLRYRVDFYRAV